MKKCPNCKAEIEENARFCLYCMTSFEEKQPVLAPNQEKNKRWLYILAAVLAFALMLCVIFLCVAAFRKSEPTNGASSDYLFSSHGDLSSISTSTQIPSSDSEQKSSEAASLSGGSGTQTSSDKTSSESKGSEAASLSGGNTQAQGGSGTQTSSNKSSSESKGSGTSTSSAGKTSSSGNTTTGSSTSSSASSEPTSSSISSASGASSSSKESSSSNTTSVSSAPSTETAEFLYRDAQYGDDYAVFTDLTNCVVITGIKTASADGRYTIPEKIDGKNVFAIMQGAFCADGISDTVKEVIVPSTVKTIWNSAFTKCYNLTDIYFCGTSIYTDPYAFADVSKRNGAITIHCSATCSDREFRTYKSYITNYLNDTLKDYSILYDEWNYED